MYKFDVLVDTLQNCVSSMYKAVDSQQCYMLV